MFFDNITMQLVAFAFLLMLIVQYRKISRLPLTSYNYYNTILALTVFNTILNLVSVYTIVNIRYTNIKFARFIHQIYIMSLIALVTSFYFYVETLGTRYKRNKLKDVLMLLPLILSIPAILLTNVEFYNDGRYVYSYGLMMWVIPTNIIIYSILITIEVKLNKKDLSEDKQNSIWSALIIWVIASVLQRFFPWLRVATVASTMMAWILFISLQNPRDLIDDETDAFNSKAYNLLVNEYFNTDKSFYIFNVVFTDISALYNLLGHDNTNKLMVKITKKFKKQFGKLVFSTGNNTLAVILDDAADLQETEKYFVEFFHKPIKSNQMSVDVNVNVYVLECPKYANNANDVFKITQHIADYFKNIGEDKVVYINEEILLKTQRIESIKAILVEAIENNGFDVMYQPIYDIKSNCFASAEALVRLSYTGDFGFISPEEYIPIAEKNGLISKIGAIVFKKVCRFASVNNISKLGVKYIEVNLSGVQAADSNISVQLKEIMDSYGIGPGFINLEITETALIDYQDILCDNMSKLRAIGCTFSMDDFGTGYSNISQLTELNYDIIKIDKSLVWPCFDEYNYNIRSSRIVLDNIVSLIQQINARIVVEGIETKEQFDYMKKLGVDYIQGYYFSKPLKENDYISYLEKNKIGARSAN